MKRLRGKGLCLSGGGYRASLFHLGALRRLHELGVLQEMTDISSVSGGSILSGFIAGRLLPSATSVTFANWDAEIAAPFRKLVRRDLRTGLFLRHALWNWAFPGPRARGLVRAYRKRISEKMLVELPAAIEFVFCATNMINGVNWEFRRAKIGDYKFAKVNTPPDMPLALAVAASACFPPIFGPIPIPRKKAGGLHALLTDGGVYDNLATEPVWDLNKVVLCSDAGAPFDLFAKNNVLRRTLRYASIGLNQVGALRKRMLLQRLLSNYETYRIFPSTAEANKHGPPPCPNASLPPNCAMTLRREVDKPAGAYWAITSHTGNYDLPPADVPTAGWYGYSDAFVDKVISRIRTDLDSFTTTEIGVLENHGYALTDIALRRHAWHVVPNKAAPFAPPHSAPPFFDEQVLTKRLKHSGSKVYFWQRWFNYG